MLKTNINVGKNAIKVRELDSNRQPFKAHTR